MEKDVVYFDLGNIEAVMPKREQVNSDLIDFIQDTFIYEHILASPHKKTHHCYPLIKRVQTK